MIQVEYWKMCRNDKDNDKESTLDLLCSLRNRNLDIIGELIQLGAMIEKSIYFENNTDK
jgi:hypothetical protein